MAVVELGRVGFCVVEVYVLGPVQLKLVPAPVAVRLIVLPAHTGELLPTVGAAGADGSLSTTGPLYAEEEQPPSVTIILV